MKKFIIELVGNDHFYDAEVFEASSIEELISKHLTPYLLATSKLTIELIVNIEISELAR